MVDIFHDQIEVLLVGKCMVYLRQERADLVALEDVSLSEHTADLVGLQQKLLGELLYGIRQPLVLGQVYLSICSLAEFLLNAEILNCAS